MGGKSRLFQTPAAGKRSFRQACRVIAIKGCGKYRGQWLTDSDLPKLGSSATVHKAIELAKLSRCRNSAPSSSSSSVGSSSKHSSSLGEVPRFRRAGNPGQHLRGSPFQFCHLNIDTLETSGKRVPRGGRHVHTDGFPMSSGRLHEIASHGFQFGF